LWEYVSKHVFKLLNGNSGSFMPNIFLKFFQRMWIIHIHFCFQCALQQKSQGFILSDHGGHGPLLVTKMLKTLCSASIGLFTMCALALSCIKYLYIFSSWASWLKKGD
jgi:hypothetical protein